MEWLKRFVLEPYTEEPGDGAGGGGNESKTADDDGQADDSTAGDRKKPEGKTDDKGDGDSKRRPSGDDKNAAWEKERAAFLRDLKKERTARQDFESRFKALESNLDAERKRVKALAGLDVGTDEEKELAQYRENLYKLHPALRKLTEEQVDKLLKLAETSGSFESTADHYWRSHGRQMVGLAVKEVQEALGGELSERQQGTLAREFISAVQADPELLERYESGDPTLASDVAKILIEDWVVPARRNHTADQVNKFRKVPNGRDRSDGKGGAPKKIDFLNPKAVEDAMVASFKEHGGEFGG